MASASASQEPEPVRAATDRQLLYIPTQQQLVAGWPHWSGAAAVLPQGDRVVHLQNVSGIDFSGLTFADADYTYQGWQSGFNAQPTSPGSPANAALRVSSSVGVTVQDCVFAELGGGGVVVGNRSQDVVVYRSSFSNVGQSAVMFVGNDTTKPYNAAVHLNTIDGVGRILASAGGVYLTVRTYLRGTVW